MNETPEAEVAAPTPIPEIAEVCRRCGGKYPCTKCRKKERDRWARRMLALRGEQTSVEHLIHELRREELGIGAE